MRNISCKIYILVFVILAVTFNGVCLNSGYAQTPDNSKSLVQAEAPATKADLIQPLQATEKASLIKIDGWNIDLERMSKAMAREGNRDKDFEQLHDDATLIQNEAAKLPDEILPKLKSLRERFSQLGPLPKDGQPAESEAITKKRTKLAEEIAEADGTVKAAQLVIIKARQIRDQIVEARRSRFVKSVTSKSFSVLDPQLWQPIQKDIAFFGKGFRILVSNIFTASANKLAANQNSIGLFIGSTLILIILLALARKALDRGKIRLGNVETDRSLRAVNALIHIVEYGVIPAAFVIGFLGVINGLELLSRHNTFFVNGVAYALTIAILARAIAYSFIRPADPALRIVELSDLAAQKINRTITVAIIVFVFSWFIYDAGRAMVASFEFGIVVKALFSLATALLAGITLRLD